MRKNKNINIIKNNIEKIWLTSKNKDKNNQNQYKENMTDEEKQKYKETKNKRNSDRYNKMIDEQKQNIEKI